MTQLLLIVLLILTWKDGEALGPALGGFLRSLVGLTKPIPPSPEPDGESQMFAPLKPLGAEDPFPIPLGKIPIMYVPGSVLGTLSSAMCEFVTQQSVIDHVNSQKTVPLIGFESERPIIDGNVVHVPLQSRLVRRYGVTVFVSRDREIFFKYETDCAKQHNIVHPLLREYYLLKKLEPTGFVPKGLFISPPVLLNLPLTPKTDFAGMNPLSCLFKAQVRYLAMTSGGNETIHEAILSKGAFSMQKALGIFKQIMVGLKEMHALDIVHGDIHPGNLVLSEDNENTVRFIDFGEAFEGSTKKSSRPIVRRPLSWVHALHSPWAMEGFRSSYRDDVYNALFVTVFMISGRGLLEYCKRLETTNPKELYVFKKDRLGNGRGLETLMDLVKAPLAVDDKPDYDAIISEIDRLL
jgi:serine/threonine protein kinase